MRQRIGDAIDALHAALDAADRDADLEDGHDAEAIDERELDDEGDPLDLGERDEAGMPLRSALVLSAWRWWRVGRLMEAAERARQAGHLHRASALLDQAQGMLRELRAGTVGETHHA